MDCSFAILLARSERGVDQDDLKMPRTNLIDQIERIRNHLGDRHIILLESGLSLPSNQASAVIWEHYDPEHFEDAILKVFTSLSANKLL